MTNTHNENVPIVCIPRYYDFLAMGINESQALVWHEAILCLEGHAISMAEGIERKAKNLRDRATWFRSAHKPILRRPKRRITVTHDGSNDQDWRPTWYMTRQHYIGDAKPEHHGLCSTRSLCGAYVFGEDSEEWQKKLGPWQLKTWQTKRPPKCKRCLLILSMREADNGTRR
jgi:hypothetical protein